MTLVSDIPAWEGNIEKLFYGVFKTLSILQQPRKSSSGKYSNNFDLSGLPLYHQVKSKVQGDLQKKLRTAGEKSTCDN
jgi:hypothetical protein